MTTIVFGLDGGNWNLISSWIENGSLPNIKRLRSGGTYGISESVLPPVTCPNWKCYATSKPPDAHNVYWWEKVDRETVTIDIPDSTSFTDPEIWDYLNDEYLSAGVMNLPMSYPPHEVNEFMIAGGPRSREEDYTKPVELEVEIEDRFGYRVHPRNVVTSNEDEEGVEATLDLIQRRFETANTLLEESDIDFLHLTIFHLNVLQHYYWNGEPVKRAWKLIDEQIGEFLDQDHTIFLMSDHGCDEIQNVFHVNEWLQSEGYLTMETSAADILMKAGVTQERLAGIVRSLGLESSIRKYIPRRIVERFPDEEGIKRDNKFEKIGTDESVAVASGQGLIYILLNPDSPEYQSVREEVVKKLGALQTARGTSVAEQVHRGEEIYPAGDRRYRPDIVFEQGLGIHTSGAVGKDEVFSSPVRWAAENVCDGMFLAHGPNVEPAGDIGRISILDIAPSVLHSMGLAIPRDFEGEPIENINPDKNEVEWRQPLPDRGTGASGESDEVQERLADLGYLE